ncbi:26781_t:CDS:2 [Racocetra persica]|uniref:26781_t:CDS:1 n=1 Tax=Racocetra persica TaxID=160502 RepID=A0ACA9KZ13_9GLOM|nr:26781_t:CDS:2 [Racocetra persica]
MTQPNTPPHNVDKNGMTPNLPMNDQVNNESHENSKQFPEFYSAVNANAEESVNKIAKAWRNHRLRREKLGKVISSESRNKLHSERFVCLHLPGHSDSCPVWLKWEELLNTIEGQLHRKDSKMASAVHVVERIGKGTRNINGHMWLILDTEHWLEICDLKHRYGANLKIYHDYWLQTESNENFFVWLDEGGGKDLDLRARPRSQLEKEKVKYLSKTERADFEVKFKDGLLVYKKSGIPVYTHRSEDSTSNSPFSLANINKSAEDDGENGSSSLHRRVSEGRNEKWIYVTDCFGNFYVGQKKKGHFHHSSFLAGGAICAAGGIKVRNGKLIELNPKSGHYKPAKHHFNALVDRLKKEGVDLNGTKLLYPSEIIETQLLTKYVKRMPDRQQVHEEINKLYHKNINSQNDEVQVHNNIEVPTLNINGDSRKNEDSHKNENIANGLPTNRIVRNIIEDDSIENQKRKSHGLFHEFRRSFSSSISSFMSLFLGDDNKTDNNSNTENSRISFRNNEDYHQQKSRLMNYKFGAQGQNKDHGENPTK